MFHGEQKSSQDYESQEKMERRIPSRVVLEILFGHIGCGQYSPFFSGVGECQIPRSLCRIYPVCGGKASSPSTGPGAPPARPGDIGPSALRRRSWPIRASLFEFFVCAFDPPVMFLAGFIFFRLRSRVAPLPKLCNELLPVRIVPPGAAAAPLVGVPIYPQLRSLGSYGKYTRACLKRSRNGFAYRIER